VWKAYIDFENEREEYDKTRALYDRLLERTKHVKVWISYAQFEASTLKDFEAARSAYQKAYKELRSAESKEERVMLVESWKEFEQGLENNQRHLTEVHKLLPERIKKKRPLKAEDGSDAGWEEYFDYIFPDERESQPNLKLIEMAHKWKKQKLNETS